MIHDRLDNLAKYECVLQLDAVLDYLSRTDVWSLPEGDIPIRGDDLYVKVQSYHPRPAAENYFETHRRYTDVQIVFRGMEQMQVTHLSNLTDHTQYDVVRDFQSFTASDEFSSIIVREGEFTVFFPGEPHRPSCRWKNLQSPVLKLVFKIKT